MASLEARGLRGGSEWVEVSERIELLRSSAPPGTEWLDESSDSLGIGLNPLRSTAGD